jgi:serine/threonine protein kinase
MNMGPVAIAVAGLLLGLLGSAGLVFAWRSGPPGAPGLVICLVAGLVAGIGEDLWLEQIGFLAASGLGLLVVPVLGLAAGAIVGLVSHWRHAVSSAEERVPGYELLAILGTGAGTVVHLARQLDLDRLVRLKRLGPGSDPQRAALASTLDNPNVAHVFGYVEHGGRAYLTGEYVEGASLRHVISASGPLQPEQALEAVRGALEGLVHAHSRGLGHGSVRPENIIVDRQGTSLLVDFGQRGPNDPQFDVRETAGVLNELFGGHPPQAVADVIAGARQGGAIGNEPSARELLRALERAAAATYGPDWRTRGSLAGAVLALLGAAGALGASGAGGAAAGAGATVEGATTVGGQAVTGGAGTASGLVSAAGGLAPVLVGAATSALIVTAVAVVPALAHHQGVTVGLGGPTAPAGVSAVHPSPSPTASVTPPAPSPSPAPRPTPTPTPPPSSPPPTAAPPPPAPTPSSGTVTLGTSGSAGSRGPAPAPPPPPPPPTAVPTPAPTPVPVSQRQSLLTLTVRLRPLLDLTVRVG